MIVELNRLVELVEDLLTDDLDVPSLASELGTTEYHLRRMFSSLAGMPLSEYVRRRRMSVAAADVLDGGNLLDIAVRFRYGSVEAFGRHSASSGTPPACRSSTRASILTSEPMSQACPRRSTGA